MITIGSPLLEEPIFYLPPKPELLPGLLAISLFFPGCTQQQKPEKPVSPPRTLAELLTPSAAPLKPDQTANKICNELPLSQSLGEKGVARRLDQLAQMGSTAAHGLTGLLHNGPPHLRMAAATLLGCPCATPGVLPHLCRALADPDRKTGIAAAYALADLGNQTAAPMLLLTVLNPDGKLDPGTRTAAAAALVRLGSPRGVPFLLAILEAAIPGSRGKEIQHGLPRKDRWALEKEIALRTLRGIAGRRFGYEPEQSWAEMSEKAAAWRQWWEKTGRNICPPPDAKLTQVFTRAARNIKQFNSANNNDWSPEKSDDRIVTQSPLAWFFSPQNRFQKAKSR